MKKLNRKTELMFFLSAVLFFLAPFFMLFFDVLVYNIGRTLGYFYPSGSNTFRYYTPSFPANLLCITCFVYGLILLLYASKRYDSERKIAVKGR
jgi:hypothetical protein